MKNDSKELMGEVVCKLKYIPVSNEALLKGNGVFLSPKTLRKQHCLGINPRIFLKFGGKLMIDIEEVEKIIAEAKRKRDIRAEKIEKIGKE